MARLWYATHPEVRLDANVPVPRWGLNEKGWARAEASRQQPWMSDVERIISSTETKALELAVIVASHLGLPIEVDDRLIETDRSQRGFQPPDEYAVVSEEWFANPATGGTTLWEPAEAVQRRMLEALEPALAGDRNVLVTGHGGAGTLLWCALAGEQIASHHDQPGGGHYFTVDLATRQPLHTWRAIDDIESAEPAGD